MRFDRYLAVLAATTALAFAPQAKATPLTPRDPAGIVSALQNAGFQAKLSKSDDGSPNIITGAGGAKILISFSGCKAGINCDYLELISYWTCTPEEQSKCDAAADSWSKEEHVATPLKASGSVAIYYYLVVEDGNFSDDMLVSTLKYFSNEATQFTSKF